MSEPSRVLPTAVFARMPHEADQSLGLQSDPISVYVISNDDTLATRAVVERNLMLHAGLEPTVASTLYLLVGDEYEKNEGELARPGTFICTSPRCRLKARFWDATRDVPGRGGSCTAIAVAYTHRRTLDDQYHTVDDWDFAAQHLADLIVTAYAKAGHPGGRVRIASVHETVCLGNENPMTTPDRNGHCVPGPGYAPPVRWNGYRHTVELLQ